MAKIVLVDDDPQMLRLIKLILEKGDHTTITVNDPLETMATIRAEAPALIILDVMMPERNGYDLCREIRAADDVGDLPIVFLTARAQEFDREVALDSGADAFHGKPVRATELLETIQRLLARPNTEGDGRIVAVFGMRGGAGRTTIAVNVAAALRRLSGAEMAIVDLAPAVGQVPIHLRLRVRASWDELEGAHEWEQVRRVLTPHPAGLAILAAPTFASSGVGWQAEPCRRLLATLRAHFPVTIVDLPAVYNEAVRAVLETADNVLHVVVPDVPGIEVARRTQRALAQEQIVCHQWEYVSNQVDPTSRLAPELVEKGLGAAPALQIEYDSRQKHALVRGQPLALTTTPSPLPRAAHVLAARIQQISSTMPDPIRVVSESGMAAMAQV